MLVKGVHFCKQIVVLFYYCSLFMLLLISISLCKPICPRMTPIVPRVTKPFDKRTQVRWVSAGGA